ncbi:exodeoxyribonuclease III [Prochlorococcus marinus str. MIT 9515]|uniref:Exodeoxyribonuclease III n=1 Tax=Prochlorococcus marinus (strain MIT 9515) TaxID=167542 RepID=A2BVE6_PROM5|nr:exodeoxyribonuclease III [Prochlorococcus marinus]ABM71757.1 exodeoxyribonuclease III [Prochlorococcus marinus str. MIT 9515]
MLIATWNVNSVRTRLSQIINWIKNVNPDILCLQETKVIDNSFPLTPFEELGYEVTVHGQKSYNGVAIISKFKIENIIKGFTNENEEKSNFLNFNEQKRLISADINGLKIINVYVPNGSSLDSDKFDYKIKWLNHLSSFLDKQVREDDLVCFVGDFNIAPFDIDIHCPQKYEGGIMASKIEREALKKVIKGRFIDSFRIFEKNTGHWSWWDYRNNAYELNKGWRIDHIYISNNLSSQLKSCVIERSQRENSQPSDHAPVLINLEIDNQSEVYFDDDDDLFEI